MISYYRKRIIIITISMDVNISNQEQVDQQNVMVIDGINVFENDIMLGK